MGVLRGVLGTLDFDWVVEVLCGMLHVDPGWVTELKGVLCGKR